MAAADCERAGLAITSSWLEAEPVDLTDPDAAATVATADLSELAGAAVLVCFGEDATATALGRGGRHVELGYALAQEIPTILVGDAEHVFHRHPAVRQVPSWEAALAYVVALVETSAVPGDRDS